MNRKVSLNEKPQRIISLVPSQTELLFDLGLEDRVVGITKFCIHPENWRKEKTIIGGTKNFRFDVIDSLKPDLIIGNKEENYEEGINELAENYPVWMSDIFTLEDSLEMMKSIGEITNSEEKSDSLIKSIQLNFDSIPNFEGKSVAYFIWKNPYMCVGDNTFINDILNNVGLNNVFKDRERYFEIDLEELKSLNLDFIFLSSEPFPFKEMNIEEFRNILQETAVVVVDGEMFSWYGSRLNLAPNYFNILYNEINA